MRTIRLISIIVVSLASYNLGFGDNRGTTGADFLKIGLGASSTGMGEAFTARLGDPIAAFYNPAGLAQMPIAQVSATHLNWISETQYEAITYAQPLLGVGTVAGSLFALHMPAIPGLDESGLATEMINVIDVACQLSYARDISLLTGIQNLSAGANVKFIYRKLSDMDAMGVAADIGAVYELMEHWTVGLSIQNLGYLSSFDTASETLPIIARLGTQYQYQIHQDHLVTTALDIVQSFDNSIKGHIGVEYGFAGTVFLRGGYKLGYDTDTFQAGAGFKYHHYAIDYALKNMGTFGLTHFITVSAGFGHTMKVAQTDKVKEMLNQAEAEFTQSNYEQALEIVKQAVMIDPKNKCALDLKDKLDTVLKMLQMPSVEGVENQEKEQKMNEFGQPLTPDELEELKGTQPEEVQQ